MRDVEKIVRIVESIRVAVPPCEVVPGVDRNEIEAVLAGIGVEPYRELVELYEVIGGAYNLSTSLSFLSLAEASACYQTYRDLSGERLTWWPSLFPLLDMNGDVQVCVDLETTDLLEIDVENGTTRLICRDYRKLLDALMEALELGIHSREPVSGALIFEKSSWARLKAKHGVQ